MGSSGTIRRNDDRRHNVSRTSLTAERVLSLLVVAPPRIAELTAGLSEKQLHAAPNEGEWSVNEVLAHLRSCADVWGGCIATILAEDRPTIRAVNPRTWIKQTDYLDLDFRPSFDAFTTQRAALLAVLEPLPPEGWLRSATVTGAGNVLERSVHGYAQWLVRHERPHLKQIARIVLAIAPVAS